MLEDKRLKIFAAVVETGSFTAAASSLGLTQPAVSQSIAELEKTLGARLFTRTRESVVLTAEGLRFSGYARQILHWYKAANEAFNPSPLSVGVPAQDGARISIDANTDATVWSCGGDIHIEISHK